MRRLTFVVAFAFLVALAPSRARAQWVRLQRCGSALPCAIPFAVRYAPDPLLAAQYGQAAPTALSGRVSLEARPTVELDRVTLSPDVSEEAARRFLLAHPPPRKATPQPTPALPSKKPRQ